ncbi:uncharacterized protein LOC110045322 isoform X2 [Orbicella faveolata]|nr:uncharacterized protein LOC110045322 isoform X2 [Orbicella faveolata]
MFASIVCAVIICLTFPSLLLFSGKGSVIDTYSFSFHSGRLIKTRKLPQCCFSFYHFWSHFHQKTAKLNTRKRSCHWRLSIWFHSGRLIKPHSITFDSISSEDRETDHAERKNPGTFCEFDDRKKTGNIDQSNHHRRFSRVGQN